MRGFVFNGPAPLESDRQKFDSSSEQSVLMFILLPSMAFFQVSPRDKTVNLELILRIPDSAKRSCPGSVSSRKCLLHEYAMNISYENLTMITWWLDPPLRFHNSSVALAFCFPNSGEMIILQGMVNWQFQSPCVQMCA